MLRTLLLIVIMLFSPNLLAQKITLANGEWAPYLSKDLKQYGYIAHIVSEAFAEEGIEVEYVFLPWKRGYEQAKEGKYDGTLIWGFSEERAADFLYSDVVAVLGTGLFVQKGKNIEWNEMKDISKYNIGGVLGYAYGTENLEASGAMKIKRISSDEANFKKLASGRLDIVLENGDVGLEIVTRLGLNDKVSLLPKLLTSRDYSVIISKNTKNAQVLVDAFNRGFQKLKADGRYQKYIEASRRGEYK
ncbi:substrate-binding periplasmic protein [Psychromonas ossibalaenae]|uniref:substrate-binding periplasmic protein n=1 Tax=Psychromonas ossibalaenae TaxID=444922 RepID=UPI0003652A97|nr:transporter substrate-binding domain-containing protein [Psychromonas ossibalaenae]